MTRQPDRPIFTLQLRAEPGADIEADHVRQTIQQMVKEGLLEHIPGKFRNGRPVYRITDLGLAELAREETRFGAPVTPLVVRKSHTYEEAPPDMNSH